MMQRWWMTKTMSSLVILVKMIHWQTAKNGVKTIGFIGISNLYDKKDDQSDSMGDDLIKVRSDIENQLNYKSQYETQENVFGQEKTIYEAHKVLKMFKMEMGNLNECVVVEQNTYY